MLLLSFVLERAEGINQSSRWASPSFYGGFRQPFLNTAIEDDWLDNTETH